LELSGLTLIELTAHMEKHTPDPVSLSEPSPQIPAENRETVFVSCAAAGNPTFTIPGLPGAVAPAVFRDICSLN
jgi:hypothetical protein